MTELKYLGEHSSATTVHEAYRASKAKYAFGWTTIEYPDSNGQRNPRRCMVAWVPGNFGQEYGVWPVHTGPDKPDLDGKTSWLWNGDAVRPTLHPSIHHINHYAAEGKGDVTVAHGFVRKGSWKPC